MREAQTAAVRLFEAHGFEKVTVEDVAAAAEVSASTVYRHFGSKEALVTWDERDPVFEAELSERLRRQRPMAAFRDSALTALAKRSDIDLFLRRLRLIFATPQIWAAAVEQDLRDRSALAIGFASARGGKEPSLQDDVLASVCMSALDVALDRWQRPGATASLEQLISEAFEVAIGMSLE